MSSNPEKNSMDLLRVLYNGGDIGHHEAQDLALALHRNLTLLRSRIHKAIFACDDNPPSSFQTVVSQVLGESGRETTALFEQTPKNWLGDKHPKNPEFQETRRMALKHVQGALEKTRYGGSK